MPGLDGDRHRARARRAGAPPPSESPAGRQPLLAHHLARVDGLGQPTDRRAARRARRRAPGARAGGRPGCCRRRGRSPGARGRAWPPAPAPGSPHAAAASSARCTTVITASPHSTASADDERPAVAGATAQRQRRRRSGGARASGARARSSRIEVDQPGEARPTLAVARRRRKGATRAYERRGVALRRRAGRPAPSSSCRTRCSELDESDEPLSSSCRSSDALVSARPSRTTRWWSTSASPGCRSCRSRCP